MARGRGRVFGGTAQAFRGSGIVAPELTEPDANGAPDWPPADALAYADFRTETYEVDGSAAVLSDIFVDDTENIGAFNLANITPGIGLVDSGSYNSNPRFAADLETAILTDGATYVLDIVMDSTSSSLGLQAYDSGFTRCLNLTLASSGASDCILLDDADALPTHLDINDEEPLHSLSLGHHKAAYSYGADGRMSASVDGRAVVVNENENDAPAFTLVFINLALATIRAVTLLPLRDDADLPALSTVS